MLVLRPGNNKLYLSLNQYNEKLGIGDINGLDVNNWHYVFYIKNLLNEWDILFQPYLNYWTGGDAWHGTDKAQRMNEFEMWAYTSGTNSWVTNGEVSLTSQNEFYWQDDLVNNSQWIYQVWAVWGEASTDGATASIDPVGMTSSRMIEEGKLLWTSDYKNII